MEVGVAYSTSKGLRPKSDNWVIKSKAQTCIYIYRIRFRYGWVFWREHYRNRLSDLKQRSRVFR
ncbi:hypothetical protein ZOSMA_82G00980 [Zostera marina]|uniref:Uncharacterized protein n=1 Tax=Zostera marina TaxID=29655 RepID=A0A0K9NNX8_ZOSMR|nr:hypothetical protein ZOSMA_82G00980 [Zostera marina]